MKQLIYLVLFLAPAIALSQNPNKQLNRIYNAVERGEDVHKISVPGVLIRTGFNIANIIEKRENRLAQEGSAVAYEEEDEVTMDDLKPFIKAIKGAKVLTIENENEIPTKQLKKSLKKLNKSNIVEPLIKIKADGNDVNIMVAEKKGKIRNLILLFSGDELIMINLKLKMKSDKLNDLIELFQKKDTATAIKENLQA